MADNFFKVKKGLQLEPKTGSTVTAEGDLAYNDTSNKLELHDGSSADPLVQEAKAATLTNKTLSGASNTINNVPAANITNTPSGNLAATDAQAALNELQSDIDTRATSTALNDHITDATDAHDASAISNSASGNLAATDVQGALNELQQDIDTRALDSDLTTHTAATAAHGATGAVVGTTNTQTLSNKSFSDAVTVAEVATPATPSSGFGKLYFKSDGKLYSLNDDGTETQVGAGQGGINYISANSDAESGTTGWATYADAAGASPVDGTGGSPNVTFTRSTSSPLRGTASFLLTKDAANRQGEGASYDFTIHSADKNKVLSIAFDYEVSSAFVTGESSDVRVWIYDVTNAVLVQPNPFYIKDSLGTFQATFPTSGSTSYRLIVHVGTTNASAWTFKLDNVKVGPQEVVFGPAMTDWQAFTLTIGATSSAPTKGTVVFDQAFWRRVGDSMEIRYDFQGGSGSAGSGNYTFSLPPGYTIDTSKARAPGTVEEAERTVGVAGVRSGGTSAHGSMHIYDGDKLIMTYDNGSGMGVVSSSNLPLSSSPVRYSFTAFVPISGWTTNVATASGRVVRVSSQLANGTRVTSTPAAIGEYRTYIKNSSATTATDSAPSAGWAPSNADGMFITGNKTFSEAGTSGQINRWEIFVGKNKHVSFQFYKDSNRTGTMDTSLFAARADSGFITMYGLFKSYDPTTGIALVDGICLFNSESQIDARFAGVEGALNGGAIDSDGVNGCYFDIIVSENALAVQQGTIRSEVIVHTGNGHGSSNTTIRRFTTVERNTGSDITYSDSSTAGALFTINTDGLYSITYDEFHGSQYQVGASKNSNQLTTAIGSITSAHRLTYATANNQSLSVSRTFTAVAGDLIRPHTNGAPTAAGDYVRFSIMKVGN